MGLKHSRDDTASLLSQYEELPDFSDNSVSFSRHDSQRQPVRRPKRLIPTDDAPINRQQSPPPSHDDVSGHLESVVDTEGTVVQNNVLDDSLVKPLVKSPRVEALALMEAQSVTSDSTASSNTSSAQPIVNFLTQQINHVIVGDESKQQHDIDRFKTPQPPPPYVRESRPPSYGDRTRQFSLSNSGRLRRSSAPFERLHQQLLLLHEKHIRTSVYSFSSASDVSEVGSTQRIRSRLSLADSQQYLADISSGDSNNASQQSLAKLPLQPNTRDNMPPVTRGNARRSNIPLSIYSCSSSDLSQERLPHATAGNKPISSEDSSTSDRAIDIKDMPSTSFNTKHEATAKLQDKLKELKLPVSNASASSASAAVAVEQSHSATLTESALTGDVMDKHGLNDLSDPASSTSRSLPCNVDSSEFSL